MIGEIAALTAAFLWALSSVVYTFLGQKIPPLQLNIFKGIVAIFLILLTLIIQNIKFAVIEPFPFILLALSGLVGIGLGDTAYFLALNNLGARKTLVLETLSPPLGALLAFMVIGETITPLAWCGILVTLLGVIWVISEQTVENSAIKTRYGIIWAILAALAQAVGAVLSRFALLDSLISPLESSLIRIIAGIAIALWLTQIPVVSVQPSLITTIKTFSRRTLGIIFLAAFGSTYLGIWLQQTSLKYAPTGIAQTLLATSPLFVIPLALIMGEKVTFKSFFGVIIAIAGISLLFIKG
jgi:drug/metabolite transporter (DMT)-like permease